MMRGVLVCARRDGSTEVIDAPPVAAFTASLVESPHPMWQAISINDGVIRVGDLLGRQAWYRITDYLDGDRDVYVGELIRILPAVR